MEAGLEKEINKSFKIKGKVKFLICEFILF